MLKEGHYETGLLWKEDKPNLPYNRQLAVQQLKIWKKNWLEMQGVFTPRLCTKTYNRTANP